MGYYLDSRSVLVVSEIIFDSFPLVLAITVSFFVLLKYLQTGFKSPDSTQSESTHYEEELQHLRNEMYKVKIVSERLSVLEANLKEVTQFADKISDTQRNELINRVRESIEKTAEGKFIDEIRASIKENQTHLNLIIKIQEQYKRTSERLSAELSALSRRGNVNLILGIFTAIIGIYLLGDIVWGNKLSTSGESIINFK